MKALATSIRILNAFAGERSTWTVSALAESLDLGASSVSKNLSCFKSAGLLSQDPDTKAYSVGISAFALGAQFLNNSPLMHESGGILRRLADTTGQTSTLCKLHGSEVLHMASVEGPHFLDVGWRVGTWLPFHATAVGKVLYAFADPRLLAEAADKKGMPRLTANTICDIKGFRKQLEKARRDGYARTTEESMQGLGAQAVPIFGGGQEVVAAIGLVYPLRAVDEQVARKQINALHAGARTISMRLGCTFYPYGEGQA